MTGYTLFEVERWIENHTPKPKVYVMECPVCEASQACTDPTYVLEFFRVHAKRCETQMIKLSENDVVVLKHGVE